MNSLEAKLDMEVIAYLTKVEDMPEVKALLTGSISKEDYTRFLKTFYIIEDIRAFHVSLRKDNGELLVYPNNLMMQKAVTLIYHTETSTEITEEAKI